MKQCLVLVLIFCGRLQIEALPEALHHLPDDQQDQRLIEPRARETVYKEKSESPFSKHFHYALSNELNNEDNTKSPSTKHKHRSSNENVVSKTQVENVSPSIKRFHYSSKDLTDDGSFEEKKQIYNVELQLHRHPNNRREEYNKKEEYSKKEDDYDNLSPIPVEKESNLKDKNIYVEEFEDSKIEKEKDKNCGPCRKNTKEDVYLTKKDHSKSNHDKKKEEKPMKLEKIEKKRSKKRDDMSHSESNGNKATKIKIRITRGIKSQNLDENDESRSYVPYDRAGSYVGDHTYMNDGGYKDQKEILDIHTFSKRHVHNEKFFKKHTVPTTQSKLQETPHIHEFTRRQIQNEDFATKSVQNDFREKDSYKTLSSKHHLYKREVQTKIQQGSIVQNNTNSKLEVPTGTDQKNNKEQTEITTTTKSLDSVNLQKNKAGDQTKIDGQKVPIKNNDSIGMQKNNSSATNSSKELGLINKTHDSIKYNDGPIPITRDPKLTKLIDNRIKMKIKNVFEGTASKRDIPATLEIKDSHELKLETKENLKTAPNVTEELGKKVDILLDPMEKESSNIHFHGSHHSAKTHNSPHKNDVNSQSTSTETPTNNTSTESTSEHSSPCSLSQKFLKKSQGNCNNTQTKVNRQVEELENHPRVFNVPEKFTPKQYLQRLQSLFKQKQKQLLEKLSRRANNTASTNLENNSSSKRKGKRIKEIRIINEDGDEIIIKPPLSREEIDDTSKNDFEVIPKKLLETKTSIDVDPEGNFNISYNPATHKYNFYNISLPENVSDKGFQMDKIKESVKIQVDNNEPTTTMYTSAITFKQKNTISTLSTTKSQEFESQKLEPDFDLQDRIDTSESKSIEDKTDLKFFDIFETSPPSTEASVETLATDATTKQKDTKHRHFHTKKPHTPTTTTTITTEKMHTTEKSKHISRNLTNICNSDIHSNISDVIILNKVKYIDDKGNVLAKLQYTNRDDPIDNLREILVIECNKTIRTNNKMGEVVNMTKKEYILDTKDYFDSDNSTEKIFEFINENITLSTENIIESKVLISDKTSKLDSHHEEETKIKLIPRKPCNHTGVYKREDFEKIKLLTTNFETKNSNNTSTNCSHSSADKHKCKHHKTEHKESKSKEEKTSLKTTSKELEEARIKVKNLLNQLSKRNETTPAEIVAITTTSDTGKTIKNITNNTVIKEHPHKTLKHRCHHNTSHSKINTPNLDNDTIDYYEELLDDIKKLAEKSWEDFHNNDKEFEEFVKKVRRSNENSTTTINPNSNDEFDSKTEEISSTTTLSTPKEIIFSNISEFKKQNNLNYTDDVQKEKARNLELLSIKLEDINDKIGNDTKEIFKRSEPTLTDKQKKNKDILEAVKMQIKNMKTLLKSNETEKNNNESITKVYERRSLENNVSKNLSTTIPDTSPNPKVIKIIVKREPEEILETSEKYYTNNNQTSLNDSEISHETLRNLNKSLENFSDTKGGKTLIKRNKNVYHVDSNEYFRENKTDINFKYSPENFLRDSQSHSIRNYLQNTIPPKKLGKIYTFIDSTTRKTDKKLNEETQPKNYNRRNVDEQQLKNHSRRSISNQNIYIKTRLLDAKRFKRRDIPFIKKQDVYYTADMKGTTSNNLKISRSPYFHRAVRNPPAKTPNYRGVRNPPTPRSMYTSKLGDFFKPDSFMAHVIQKRNPLLIKDGSNPNANLKELLIQSSPKTQFLMFKLSTQTPTTPVTEKIKKAHFAKGDLKKQGLLSNIPYGNNKKKFYYR